MADVLWNCPTCGERHSTAGAAELVQVRAERDEAKTKLDRFLSLDYKINGRTVPELNSALTELLAAVREHLEHDWDRCKDDEALVATIRRIRGGGSLSAPNETNEA